MEPSRSLLRGSLSTSSDVLHGGGGWREDILETAWLLSLRHTLKDLLISPLSVEPHGCEITRARVELLNVHFHTLWHLVAGADTTYELDDGLVAEGTTEARAAATKAAVAAAVAAAREAAFSSDERTQRRLRLSWVQPSNPHSASGKPCGYGPSHVCAVSCFACPGSIRMKPSATTLSGLGLPVDEGLPRFFQIAGGLCRIVAGLVSVSCVLRTAPGARAW